MDENALADTLASLASPAGAALPPSVPVGAERFVAGELIGQGGMGRVTEAADRQFGRKVALKELRQVNDDGARRLAVEALVTGNLEHPGIPAVYERGIKDGMPYYAMRRIDGRPLSELLGEARTLSERLRLLPTVVQVAQTLGFAHSRGVVHRDIKPANILVGKHGDAVVVDWGIARVRGAAAEFVHAVMAPPSGDSLETAHGSLLGTLAYMSPEQARGESGAIDERTDVFALGALLYHLLSGRAPFAGKPPTVALTCALEVRCEPIDQAAAGAPAPLRAIVARAMNVEPSRRYANADQFADALGAVLTDAVQREPPSVIARAAVDVTVAVSVVLAVLGAALAVKAMPAFRFLGAGAWAIVIATVMGVALSLLEWSTRGRHSLSPLALGFALATVTAGFASVASNFASVFDHLKSITDQPDVYRDHFTQGAWEAIGALTLAMGLASAQFVLWGIARRSAQLAERKAKP
jgi:hypothetical protein